MLGSVPTQGQKSLKKVTFSREKRGQERVGDILWDAGGPHAGKVVFGVFKNSQGWFKDGATVLGPSTFYVGDLQERT